MDVQVREIHEGDLVYIARGKSKFLGATAKVLSVLSDGLQVQTGGAVVKVSSKSVDYLTSDPDKIDELLPAVSKKNVGPGKNRIFDSEIISELVDIRIKEQVPWVDLPDRYMELLPEGTFETKPHFETLRNVMMKDVDAILIPTRVNKKMRARIAAEFDKADLGSMMMTVTMAQYREWDNLHVKMLQYAAVTGVEDDENNPKIKFSRDDRDRMDKLANEVTSKLFRVMDYMKTIRHDDNSLFLLMENVSGTSPGITERPIEVDGTVVDTTRELMEEVGKQTQSIMAGILEVHKSSGVGGYRVMPEREVDNIEDLLEEGQ